MSTSPDQRAGRSAASDRQQRSSATEAPRTIDSSKSTTLAAQPTNTPELTIADMPIWAGRHEAPGVILARRSVPSLADLTSPAVRCGRLPTADEVRRQPTVSGAGHVSGLPPSGRSGTATTMRREDQFVSEGSGMACSWVNRPDRLVRSTCEVPLVADGSRPAGSP
jgi:hypothetical protein